MHVHWRWKLFFKENSQILSYQVGPWRTTKYSYYLRYHLPYLRISFCTLDQNVIVFLFENEYSERKKMRGEQEWKEKEEGKDEWKENEEIEKLLTSSDERWGTGPKRQMQPSQLLPALWATLCFFPPNLTTLHVIKIPYIPSSLFSLPYGKMSSKAHHCPISHWSRGN